MSFLDLLRPTDFCNHNNASAYVQRAKDGDRILTCRECDSFLSLRHFLCRVISSYASPRYAQLYANWSGDDGVPCTLPTRALRYRAPVSGFHETTLKTVFEGCTLLRIINAPFVNRTPEEEDEGPTTSDFTFFRVTVESTLERLWDRVSYDVDPVIASLASTAFAYLKRTFSAERYFNEWVPYVIGVSGRTEKPLEEITSVGLDSKVWRHMYDSIRLHRIYGQFSFAFDAVHVAVLCCLCQDDIDLVRNLVFDWAGKTLVGFYDAAMRNTTSSYDICRQLLEKPFEERPMEFYRVLLETGGETLACAISDVLFRADFMLENKITAQLPRNVIYSRRPLFRDLADYFAFLAVQSYYKIARGDDVLSECRRRYRWIRKCISRVAAFQTCMVEAYWQGKGFVDQEEDFKKQTTLKRNFYWSTKTVRRMLDCCPEFENELVEHMSQTFS